MAAHRLLARQHHGQHRCQRHEIEFPHRRLVGGDHRQRHPPNGGHAQRHTREDDAGIFGEAGYETPNGTYYVLEKFADMVMDSSTYGVPVDSAEGYKLKVQDAVRINNAGIFVHGAPWSVADQGKRNVSHGCPNLSPANAQWFYDNFGSGDPVVVKNSVGIYDENDGAQDWQI